MKITLFNRSLSARQTMVLTTICFALLTLGVGIMAYVSRHYSRKGTLQTRTLTEEFLPGLAALNRLQDATLNLRRLAYQSTMAPDEEAIQVLDKESRQYSEAVARNIEELMRLAHNDQTKRLINELNSEVQDFLTWSEKLKRTLRIGDFVPAMTILDKQIGPRQLRIGQQLHILTENYFQEATQASDLATGLLGQSERFGLMATAVVGGFTLFCLMLFLLGIRIWLKQTDAREAERLATQKLLEQHVEERTQQLRIEILAHQRVAEELQNSEQFLHSLFEYLPICVYRKDREGRYTFVNRMYCEWANLSPDEIVGRTIFDLRPAEVAQPLHEEAMAVMESRQRRDETRQTANGQGQPLWLQLIMVPVEDGSGGIAGMQGMFWDVTALHEAQEEAAREQARLKLIFDSVPVGVSLQTVLPGGGTTFMINDAHLRICGVTREAAADPATISALTPPEDNKRQKILINQLNVGLIHQYTLEKRFITPAGKTVWVIYSSQRFRYADGRIDYISSVVDITSRKQSESEMEKVHRQLLDTSRQAGMAEVATGVLHNVGNVLNSVNVSATLVSDQFRRSKSANLARVHTMLCEHAADLADYLANDPKGKLVVPYLGSLVEELATERQGIAAELDNLKKNIEHIKDIVVMQQNYAKTSGVTETISVPDLVEDAIRMNAGSLARHDVDVLRDYSVRPVVTVEKHKVLQILVNLIRNAKYACDESGRTDKKLKFRIEADDQGVKIAVADNGVGIKPENLTRIFSHGFTTRKEGHGFGLHSGALAAKELGGSLVGLSDGPGKGATFVLNLPYSTEALTHEQPAA